MDEKEKPNEGRIRWFRIDSIALKRSLKVVTKVNDALSFPQFDQNQLDSGKIVEFIEDKLVDGVFRWIRDICREYGCSFQLNESLIASRDETQSSDAILAKIFYSKNQQRLIIGQNIRENGSFEHHDIAWFGQLYLKKWSVPDTVVHRLVKSLRSSVAKFLKDFDSKVSHYTDSAARVELNKQLFKDSRQDQLTWLWNRMALNDSIAEVSRSEEWEYAMLILDTDHFKSINDTFSHDMWDEALREIAVVFQDLEKRFHQHKVRFFRYGWEEFLGMYPVNDVTRNLPELLLGEIRKIRIWLSWADMEMTKKKKREYDRRERMRQRYNILLWSRWVRHWEWEVYENKFNKRHPPLAKPKEVNWKELSFTASIGVASVHLGSEQDNNSVLLRHGLSAADELVFIAKDRWRNQIVSVINNTEKGKVRLLKDTLWGWERLRDIHGTLLEPSDIVQADSWFWREL